MGEGEFDPDALDLDKINRELQRLKKPRWGSSNNNFVDHRWSTDTENRRALGRCSLNL